MNISFYLTTPQFRARTKTVTRRCKWKNLKAGQRLRAVVKGQGLKMGEQVDVLGIIEIVSVRRERLNEITDADVIAEGFPAMTRQEFIEMFCRNMKCEATDFVTRIEFKYVD